MGKIQANLNYFYEENPNQVLFESAEEAWFWFCKYDNMKNGHKSKTSNIVISRPCVLDDIYIVVSKLYLARKIKERHLKTLIKYGRMQIAPDERIVDEQDEAIWWSDAMDKIETVLIKKGIVKCENSES
ncbi:MAG: hypothetical protein K6F04_04050 [bacterium]|nr:hypothetical protein [bacterium]